MLILAQQGFVQRMGAGGREGGGVGGIPLPEFSKLIIFLILSSYFHGPRSNLNASKFGGGGFAPQNSPLGV